MKQADLEKAVLWFRWRVFFILFCKYAFIQMTCWLFLWGAVVLLTRSTWGWDSGNLFWGIVGIAPLLLISGFAAARRVPAPGTVLAAIDRRSQAGGLYMAQNEVPVSGWHSRMAPGRSPQLRWYGQKWTGLLLLAILFVGVSFLVPQKYIDTAYANRLEVGEHVEQMKEQIKTLEEEEILESADVSELQKQLEQVRDEARGHDPVKTLESLDTIKEKLTRAAENQAQKALMQTQQMSQAEVLSDALADVKDRLAPEISDAAMKELASLMQKSLDSNQKLLANLDPELKKQLGKLSRLELSPEQLDKLCEGLQGAKKELNISLQKLAEMGLLDLEALSRCENAGQCNSDALKAFLLKEAQDGKLRDAVGLCTGAMCQNPGITRGRADAEMTWKQPGTTEGFEFKEQTLPPSVLSALKDSTLYGMDQTAPTVNDAVVDGGPSVLSGAAAGGGSAQSTVIHPKHRQAVGRYFKRN